MKSYYNIRYEIILGGVPVLIESKMKIFNSLWNEISVTYHDVALKLGLSDSAMMILYSICSNGNECMLSDIVNTTNISKQTVNSALRNLEADGIIYLELVGSRKKKVCLTDKGKGLVKNTVYKLINIENKIYNSWSKEDSNLYLHLTQKFLDEFRNETKDL